MIVAVQGCSHGSLSAIYDSIAQYESHQSKKVDLLLLCGDFQALRSAHDFASLAVPPKYHALGTFHEFYSGKRVAPCLTLVIGGNHEASNYMWELYHGGWLAENIYYLGAAGCVRVNGLRISGASGIYKDNDYTKGHFETVPYNTSTMRSIYHIRNYEVAKLMQLTPEEGSIFLSHDWPLTIPNHGDTAALLRRKPYFKSEVQSNTLGSPPLLQLLKHNQPAYWFSAHLHVKFAAVYEHGESAARDGGVSGAASAGNVNVNARIEGKETSAGNPDEIVLDDDEDEEEETPVVNPDEIEIDDDDDGEDIDEEPQITDGQMNGNGDGSIDGIQPEEAKEALAVDESADLVESARQLDPDAAQGVIGATKGVVSDVGTEVEAGPSRSQGERRTKFLALDKCGPGKDFIQFLDIPTPQPLPDSSPQSDISPLSAPTLTYDPEWLAITRVFHPYLSLEYRQKTLPLPDHMAGLVQAELERIRSEGLTIPPHNNPNGDGALGNDGVSGHVEVGKIQKFKRTAPAHGEPGGSESAWYTNPQTEAFCTMLGIPNKINPAPSSDSAAA